MKKPARSHIKLLIKSLLITLILLILAGYFLITLTQSKYYSINLLHNNQSGTPYLEKLEINNKPYIINQDIPPNSDTYNFNMSRSFLEFEEKSKLNITFTIRNKENNQTITPSCSVTFEEESSDNCFLLVRLENDRVSCICDF
ncbi:hypothetical protein A7P95_06430 [Eikenella longinqua]|uniref:Uncharacterized protein n=1 Tax=Eikenella longinqua TaxID=1795827 RepID=A0A1A9RXJ2_9NEIS|nr:hypothetical protein [Eikenella longinqua]OAM27748.1 hypothetical protein A7P95_06430 [Eikenella longinqua]